MIKTCTNCKYKDIDYFNEYPCCECDNKSRWEQRKNTNYQPTMKDLMIEKLEKIKAELDDLDRHFDNDYFSGNKESMFKCKEVFEIIDNHISELKGENE